MTAPIDVAEAISAAKQAIQFDQDVDPAVVQVLLDELFRLRSQSHGDRVEAIVGDPLPFLVRFATVKAVFAAVQQWRDAGAPTELPELKRLYGIGEP